MKHGLSSQISSSWLLYIIAQTETQRSGVLPPNLCHLYDWFMRVQHQRRVTGGGNLQIAGHEYEYLLSK